jgi:hypothetical protein
MDDAARAGPGEAQRASRLLPLLPLVSLIHHAVPSAFMQSPVTLEGRLTLSRLWNLYSPRVRDGIYNWRASRGGQMAEG